MADANTEYLKSVQLDDIPWHRLPTVYGRATDFPVLLQQLTSNNDSIGDKAGRTLMMNIEHQSTLWYATPFAMIFLGRIFVQTVQAQNWFLTANLLELFIEIEQCYQLGNDVPHATPFPLFSDMLREEYLWPEEYDEDADLERYESGTPFPDDLFYSFYYYSHFAIAFYLPQIEQLTHCEDVSTKDFAEKLYNLLK